MITSPTHPTTRMSHAEQVELARARAREAGLHAYRLGNGAYLVKSVDYAPGAWWLLTPRADETGWDCLCPSSGVCRHQGAVYNSLARTRGRLPVPQPWRDAVAPRPEPPRRDLTPDERARVRALCSRQRASVNPMPALMSGMLPPVADELRAIADRVTADDLFPEVG